MLTQRERELASREADLEVREGMKVFSSWPTFPQLYVNGEFVGGCDIVRQLDEQDELRGALGALADRPGEILVFLGFRPAQSSLTLATVRGLARSRWTPWPGSHRR